MNKNRALRRYSFLVIMGLLLVAAILFAALTVGGSRSETERASEMMWKYIDEKYPEVNPENHGAIPEYSGGCYSLSVTDSACADICFKVVYTNGNIVDDYYYKVEKMTNTLLRLENEMGEYFGNIMTESNSDLIWAEVTFPPRVRNDIPSDIYPGVELDPTHPIFRDSTLTLVCLATDNMNTVAALINKAHSLATDNGILFSEYSVYGLQSGSLYSLEISGVTADLAENAELGALLERALEENVSESDIGVISVKLYYAGM